MSNMDRLLKAKKQREIHESISFPADVTVKPAHLSSKRSLTSLSSADKAYRRYSSANQSIMSTYSDMTIASNLSEASNYSFSSVSSDSRSILSSSSSGSKSNDLKYNKMHSRLNVNGAPFGDESLAKLTALNAPTSHRLFEKHNKPESSENMMMSASAFKDRSFNPSLPHLISEEDNLEHTNGRQSLSDEEVTDVIISWDQITTTSSSLSNGSDQAMTLEQQYHTQIPGIPNPYTKSNESVLDSFGNVRTTSNGFHGDNNTIDCNLGFYLKEAANDIFTTGKESSSMLVHDSLLRSNQPPREKQSMISSFPATSLGYDDNFLARQESEQKLMRQNRLMEEAQNAANMEDQENRSTNKARMRGLIKKIGLKK